MCGSGRAFRRRPSHASWGRRSRDRRRAGGGRGRLRRRRSRRRESRIPHDGRITVIGEHTDGTYCELKAISAGQLYPLAESLSFEEGAAFPLTFETAYRMLVTKAAVREGEWVLIWGIGGGVALAAFELCRALGARTIVTSSSREKLERARELGADVAVSHSDDDVVQAVKEATEGRGADIVVETVGEATWERSLCRGAGGPRGRMRCDVGSQPARALVSALVETARRLRLDHGPPRRLRGRVRARSIRTGARARGRRVSARGGGSSARAPRVGCAVRQGRTANPRSRPLPPWARESRRAES